jgi:hypothetical protein
MIITRAALLALALTSLSLEAGASAPWRHPVSSTTVTSSGFGSCARGPCIRQADTHTKARPAH